MAPVLVSLYGISRTKQIIMLVVCKLYARFTAKYAKLCFYFLLEIWQDHLKHYATNRRVNGKHITSIPANFFWDISMRFLSWECWDFWRRHDHFRRFPKKSEDFRSLPKAKLLSPSLRTRINSSSLPVLFSSNIRDREEGIVIYSFYIRFSFLTWVWVNIFLEIVSSKTATIHIFQSGVRNWPASVSRREI